MSAIPPSRLRALAVMAGLAGALVLALLFSAAAGVEHVDWAAALRPDTAEHAIVFRARLGRALLGAVVGASLGAAGVASQALVRNPLADPYDLGESSGASVGTAIAIAFGAVEGAPVAGCAFAGALVARGLVYRLGLVRGRLVPYVALLAGVVLNALSWALILTIATLARLGTTAEILLWLMGSLSPPAWSRLGLTTAAVILGVAAQQQQAPRQHAHAEGVDVPRTRKLLLIAASFLTAAGVAVAGPSGFVAIIVPHVLRLLVGTAHRVLIPASALGGALFLSLCDTLTRLAFVPLGAEPPVSVLTALLGGPFFLVLLWQRRGERLF